MKKSRLLILLGLVLCLLLTAFALAEEEAPAVAAEETSRIIEADGFTLERLGDETNECRIIGVSADLVHNGVLILPDQLSRDDVYLVGYAPSLITEDLRILIVPWRYDIWMSEDEAPDQKVEYSVILYKGFKQLSEDELDHLPDMKKGEYALIEYFRQVINRNGNTSRNWDGQALLLAEDIPEEINGAKAWNLIDPSRITQQEGDWQYSFSGNDDNINIIGYTGATDSTLIVPEIIAGHRVDRIYLFAIPAEVERIFLPYRVYLSSNRSSFGLNDSRTILVINYISYENASDYSTSLYDDETFTEGSYAGVYLNRYTYTASGEGQDDNVTLPADSFPTEINGKPFHLGNISRNATYTSGDYTYSLYRDGRLYLMNGTPTDRENALFFPSYVDGKRVQYINITEIPEGITELYLPYNSYLSNSPKTSADVNIYFYIDYEMAHDEDNRYSNYDILAGELLLNGAQTYKTNGNSDRLVQDYYAFPSEICGMPIRNNLSNDYIQTYTSEPYTYYKMTENEICICAFSDSDARKVTVPDTIDGLTVIAISTMDYNRVFNVQNATEINLPSTLKILGNRALYSYKAKSLTLPEGLVEIGTDAIYLSNLGSINLPSSLQRLGANALYGTRIKKLTIPAGITSLPDGCFSNMWYLNTLELPAGMTAISASLCESCNNLGTIVLPEGITSIGENAFRNCYKLKSVTIPASVTEIGKSAFNNCSRLGSVKFAGTGITIIDESTFVDCKSLSKIDLPEGLVEIKRQAFYGTKLAQVVIPSTVKKIESVAFGSCAGLGKVTMGAGVEDIAKDAFEDCKKNLTITAPEGSYAQTWAETNGIAFKPAK